METKIPKSSAFKLLNNFQPRILYPAKLLIETEGHLPNGLVIKILPFQCRGCGFNPYLGKKDICGMTKVLLFLFCFLNILQGILQIYLYQSTLKFTKQIRRKYQKLMSIKGWYFKLFPFSLFASSGSSIMNKIVS